LLEELDKCDNYVFRTPEDQSLRKPAELIRELDDGKDVIVYGPCEKLISGQEKAEIQFAIKRIVENEWILYGKGREPVRNGSGWCPRSNLKKDAILSSQFIFRDIGNKLAISSSKVMEELEKSHDLLVNGPCERLIRDPGTLRPTKKAPKKDDIPKDQIHECGHVGTYIYQKEGQAYFVNEDGEERYILLLPQGKSIR